MPLITRFLDTLTPTVNWQSFGVGSIGSDSYRLTCNGTPGDFNKFQGWLLLRAVYRDGSVSPARRINPTPGSQIIELPLPDVLRTGNDVGRIWQIKRAWRHRTQRLGPAGITVTLEEVTGVDDE